MAVITRNVTKDTRTAVITAPRNLTVTVDLTGITFSVYIVVNNGAQEYKAQHDQTFAFDVNSGDIIEANSVGTGTITVTTVNRP